MHKDKKITIVYGEFSSYLQEVVGFLERATEYAANDLQRDMLKDYIAHYKSGSIDLHKES
jgi:dipeptidyl-peptidase-3